MPQPEPFFREAGTGPGVVCIHSNASSSSQWRALMERLAPRFHVLAPDCHGAGKGPPWPAGGGLALRDEAALLEPVFARAGEPFTLVGHSYGGAVALIAALLQPQRVRALVLYEPTLFALVDGRSPPPNDTEGIRRAVGLAQAELGAGRRGAAARHFIDYWMGAGAWDAMPEARRAPIEAAVVNVGGWAHALLGEPTPLAAFSALRMPVLLMTGGRSTASAWAVADTLASVLPRVERLVFDDLGHMGPITDPEPVNAAIDAFLSR